jgi:hypothetical protein
MKTSLQCPNQCPVTLHFQRSLLLIFLTIVCHGVAQVPDPPAGSLESRSSNTGPLAVTVDTAWSRRQYPASADIRLVGCVSMSGTRKPGDFVTVDFYVATNKVGSAKSVWHGAIFPPNVRGQAQYMHVVAAGFDPAEVVWKNVAAGNYAVTARAHSNNGLSCVSAPVSIVVTR